MSILRKKVGNDIPFEVQLQKDDKLIVWSDMQSLKLFMKNDGQLGWRGQCEFTFSEDGMTIHAIFRGSKGSFVGVHRVVLSFIDLAGNAVEVDSVVFVMVQTSSELSHEVIEYNLGDESGTTITTEEGLIIKVNADTYELTNKTID